MGLGKIPISFKSDEEDIYKYIKTKRNASCYIKDLVEADMKSSKERVIEIEPVKNNDFGLDF